MQYWDALLCYLPVPQLMAREVTSSLPWMHSHQALSLTLLWSNSCQCPQGLPRCLGQLSFCGHPASLWAELGTVNHSPFYTNWGGFWNTYAPSLSPGFFNLLGQGTLIRSLSVGMPSSSCHLFSTSLIISPDDCRLLQSCSLRKHLLMCFERSMSETALLMPSTP